MLSNTGRGIARLLLAYRYKLTGFEASIEELFHDEFVGGVHGVVQHLHETSVLVPVIHRWGYPKTQKKKVVFFPRSMQTRVHGM